MFCVFDWPITEIFLMTVSYTKDDILKQLDYCAGDYTFPMLSNGYIYLGDTRLSAYRDENRWAIVIEVVGYNVRAGCHNGLNNCRHCFGNCLLRPPGTANEDFLVVTEDSPDDPTFQEECDWYILTCILRSMPVLPAYW
jgi:hypothetical protein